MLSFLPLLLACLPLVSSVYVASADGTKIWAESTGDPSKPAVVFAPGFSLSSLAFEKQWESHFMKANLFMVRYDVRGQGISDQPLKESAYGSQQHAQDFKAVIDHFGIGDRRPIFAGWSMGGVIAVDIATYYGVDLIRGVVLLGSFPHRNMLHAVSTPYGVNLTLRLLDPSLAAFGPTVKEFVESCVAYGDELDQGTKYSWMGAVAGQHPDIRVWSLPHTQNETALMNAAKTLPYLVLHGTMDKLVDGTKVREWMEPRFGNFMFRLWEKTGHAPFWDSPEMTNREIVAFAKKLCSAGLVLEPTTF